jgi:flagellar biogenesis protein FliO
VSLSNKQSIVLLRVDDREFVVGCCGDSVVLLAPPPAEQVKERPKPRVRAKKKIVQPPVLAPVESVEPIAVPVKPRRSAKAKAAAQIELPLKRRVPTKARLVKSFAGRSR